MKEDSYKEKLIVLAPLMSHLIESIKKDLKNDHIRADSSFSRRYFTGKHHNKLSTEELAEAYSHALVNHENAESIAEFITNRWLMKHGDIYYHFEKGLSEINPDFTSLDILDVETSIPLMEKAIAEFGSPATYFFCILNGVVFPEEIFKQLALRAQEELNDASQRKESEAERLLAETEEKNHALQIARLTDKYEKKLTGMQKKYTTDIESLKKQIALLQRKLNA